MDSQRSHTRTARTRPAARPVVARESRQRREKAQVLPLVPRVPRSSGPRTPAVAESASSFVRDSYASTAFAEIIDRSVHAAAARFTAGLSPMAMIGAYMDWAAHVAFSPGKQMRLAEKAMKKAVRFANYAGRCALRREGGEPCIVPLPQDHRFDGPAWQNPPYNVIYQSFLLTQQWWHNAMTGVRGVTRQNEKVVAFATRQFLDVLSPSNFPLTNPEVLERTLSEGGMNFVRGAQNFAEDWDRAISGRPPVG
ncbi:MAG: poly-beta-hydroxybutyrate polymerase N-terminal domain-containing protein, partial [Betaproteobacteria bacterium]|nr:poly-beta-hydroxybutyrate polymerase N-terminal domain-containing protein [Betaproteobacteria bacterium]